ncbi:chemotaxis protein CheW [uncultured Porticoccus sp.]|uniref:chemotaxis protein CheW n=1 Tax=uncultured Porticoccus sp. TaxID=1256050 RepID=UPI0030DCB799
MSKPVADNPLLPDEVDSLLVSLSGHRLLVPMAAVAEIVQQVDCQRDDHQPPWLQGWINWRTERIPLLSFESLVGHERAALGDRAMALVLYRILPDGLSRFYALQVQNFPHLIRLADDGLLQQVSLPELSPYVLMMVAVREQQAFIPDLDKIEQLLAEVL